MTLSCLRSWSEQSLHLLHHPRDGGRDSRERDLGGSYLADPSPAPVSPLDLRPFNLEEQFWFARLSDFFFILQKRHYILSECRCNIIFYVNYFRVYLVARLFLEESMTMLLLKSIIFTQDYDQWIVFHAAHIYCNRKITVNNFKYIYLKMF